MSTLRMILNAPAEVNGLQHSASYLAHTGGPPPPGVWERLESAIQGSTRASRLHRRGWCGRAAPRTVSLAMGRCRRVRRGHRVRRRSGCPLADPIPGVRAALRRSPARPRTAPGARKAKLVDAGGKVLATAVVLRDGTGYLTSQLPPLPAGRTYQLWGIDDQNTILLGVMGRNPDVVAFQAAGHPVAIGVTDERAGGVTVTGNKPAAVGELKV